MRIGTMRAEEAKVFDSDAGYHPFHNETGETYGSFEVYWSDGEQDEDGSISGAGWYWIAQFPGCMPDGEASGPFATSTKARIDADEFWDIT